MNDEDYDSDGYSDYLVEWQRRFGNSPAAILEVDHSHPGTQQTVCARMSLNQYKCAYNQYQSGCNGKTGMRLRAMLLIDSGDL